jgi:hypothetical protein
MLEHHQCSSTSAAPSMQMVTQRKDEQSLSIIKNTGFVHNGIFLSHEEE